MDAQEHTPTVLPSLEQGGEKRPKGVSSLSRVLWESHHKGSTTVRQAFSISLVTLATDALSPVLGVCSVCYGITSGQALQPPGLEQVELREA